MTMSIAEAAINLGAALGLSAVIGFERQWRNRLAGLRTNSLVSLGAATFVVFAALVPGDASPTRVGFARGSIGPAIRVSDRGAAASSSVESSAVAARADTAP